ncbi:hypothetical protein I79_019840 [Cricetulus griseus]|uniref:Uncharacterized protein n=1 Tax=Cricetulus griseus TaxID=10029 RepID=G3I8G7_CRIGR|nr:hypothetical protein I79_019840 [Cricetulus griseus]
MNRSALCTGTGLCCVLIVSYDNLKLNSVLCNTCYSDTGNGWHVVKGRQAMGRGHTALGLVASGAVSYVALLLSSVGAVMTSQGGNDDVNRKLTEKNEGKCRIVDMKVN